MNKIKSHGYTALFFPYLIPPHCLLCKLNEAIASWRVCWSGIPKAYLSVLLVRMWHMGGNWPLLVSGSSWGKWKEMLHDQRFPKRRLRQQHTQEVDELPTFLSNSCPILNMSFLSFRKFLLTTYSKPQYVWNALSDWEGLKNIIKARYCHCKCQSTILWNELFLRDWFPIIDCTDTFLFLWFQTLHHKRTLS